jgi:hypothetical protein
LLTHPRAIAALAALDVVLALTVLVLIGVATQSSWSTFIPDLIVGILPAGLIGGALLIYQRRVERRDRSREAAREWASARRQVLDALPDISTAAAKVGLDRVNDHFASLSKATRGLPLAEWLYLTSASDLSALSRLRVDLQLLTDEGSDLESMIEVELDHRDSRNAARCLIAGIDLPVPQTGQALRRLEQHAGAAHSMLNDDLVASLAASYGMRLSSVVDQTEALRLQLANLDYLRLSQQPSI